MMDPDADEEQAQLVAHDAAVVRVEEHRALHEEARQQLGLDLMRGAAPHTMASSSVVRKYGLLTTLCESNCQMRRGRGE